MKFTWLSGSGGIFVTQTPGALWYCFDESKAYQLHPIDTSAGLRWYATRTPDKPPGKFLKEHNPRDDLYRRGTFLESGLLRDQQNRESSKMQTLIPLPEGHDVSSCSSDSFADAADPGTDDAKAHVISHLEEELWE